MEKKKQQHTSFFFYCGTQTGGVYSSHCRQIMQQENRRLFAPHNDHCVDTHLVRKRITTFPARQQKAARHQQIIAHGEAVKNRPGLAKLTKQWLPGVRLRKCCEVTCTNITETFLVCILFLSFSHCEQSVRFSVPGSLLLEVAYTWIFQRMSSIFLGL